MDQDKAVNRILRDLKQFDLVVKDITGELRSGEYRIYLNALWVAGWEEARLEMSRLRTNKPVTRENEDHIKIKEYPSIELASRAMKVSRETIARAVKTGNKTIKHEYWKFKEGV